MNFKGLFNDQYFMGDVNKLNQIIHEEGINELKSAFSKFNKLPEEYRKIIVVLPLTNLSDGFIQEFFTEASFDTNRIKSGEFNDKIDNFGKEKIYLYIRKIIKKVPEFDVYNFMKNLTNNEDVFNKYIEALNNVFYKNIIDKENINKNKNVIKIRRKYE